MATSRSRRPRRVRGNVEELPSGALRVSVYAGIDPLSGRRHYLRETVPAGPARRRQPRRSAAGSPTRSTSAATRGRARPWSSCSIGTSRCSTSSADTVENYRRLARLHIRPLIGGQKVGALDADTFDSFYAELRRCRDHCDRPYLHHRTTVEHECDARCGPHECRPLAASSIRQIHFILSGALKRAVRWRWIADEPDLAGPATRDADAEPEAPDPRRGRPDPERGVAGSGLGPARLAGDGDRGSPRGAVRPALAGHRPPDRGVDAHPQPPPAGEPDVGEGHEDPPEQAHRAGPGHRDTARRLPRAPRRRSRDARRRARPRPRSCSRGTCKA